MKTKTIYTITETDDLDLEPLRHLVIGSYRSRGRAIDELTKRIFERMETRDDLALSFAADENHPEMEDALEWKDGHPVYSDKDKAVAFVRDEIGGQGCYYVCCGYDVFRFDLDENEAEENDQDRQLDRYHGKLEQAQEAARRVVDAIRDDLKDDAHKDGNGHSCVVMHRVCPAADCFTRDFNALVEDLSGAIEDADKAFEATASGEEA